MSHDYYLILEINREACEADVAKAYRKLSLRWHPKLSKEDYNTTYHHFCLISEAYEVLSDRKYHPIIEAIKRTFYDKYGEEKLKEGFFANGNLKGGYRFAGNPEEIFERFFGTANPFAQLIGSYIRMSLDGDGREAHGSLFSHAFGAQDFNGIKPPSPLEVIVECTLNEIYNGCSKRVTYKRTVLNKDGRTTRDVIESKYRVPRILRDIQIKQGIHDNQVIVFPQLGNEVAAQKPSDLIFKIKEVPHPLFKRKANDLVYVAKISLANAICADPIQIVTLDNRKLQIPIDEIVSPKSIREILGEGMPEFAKDEYKVENFGVPPRRGNLYVRFDIKFPVNLSEESKQKIKELLSE